jgi:hypothetical protein
VLVLVKQTFRLLLAAALVTLLAVPASRAETTKERRARQAEEKTRQAEEKKEKQQASKAADAQKLQEQKVLKVVRERYAPKTVKLPEHGFQYTTLQDWSVNEVRGIPGSVSAAHFYANLEEQARTSTFRSTDALIVRVLPIEAGKSIDDVMAHETKRLNCCGPHFAIKPEKDVLISGEMARSIVVEPVQDAYKTMKWHFVAAQHGDKAYIFQLQTSPDTYDTVRPGAEKIIQSVKWIGPKVKPTPLPTTTTRPTGSAAGATTKPSARPVAAAAVKIPAAPITPAPSQPGPADGF